MEEHGIPGCWTIVHLFVAEFASPREWRDGIGFVGETRTSTHVVSLP